MTQVKRRATALNPIEFFKQHQVLKVEADALKARAEKVKKDLKEWFPDAKGVYTNEQGSKFYDFPETVTVKGVAYKGMELRRSSSVLFDEDEAEKRLKRRKIDPSEYTETIVVIDQDKVRRLQQEGKITEKDIDAMFVESAPSWAFWSVKGEVL